MKIKHDGAQVDVAGKNCPKLTCFHIDGNDTSCSVRDKEGCPRAGLCQNCQWTLYSHELFFKGEVICPKCSSTDIHYHYTADEPPPYVLYRTITKKSKDNSIVVHRMMNSQGHADAIIHLPAGSIRNTFTSDDHKERAAELVKMLAEIMNDNSVLPDNPPHPYCKDTIIIKNFLSYNVPRSCK